MSPAPLKITDARIFAFVCYYCCMHYTSITVHVSFSQNEVIYTTVTNSTFMNSYELFIAEP